MNYTPLHARAEPDDFEEYRMRRMKTISLKNKEAKVLKRKQNHTSQVGGGAASEYNQGFLKDCGPSGAALDCNRTFRKVLDEDTSNRSSSGSAISNSESCLQLANADASDLTGPAQSIVRDSTVPSRKRTCVNHPKQSSVEKLTKDLYTILHEQQSYMSGSSEEDLLFDSDTPMVSVEIGHGSVLIRHPSTIAREEESEASSLSIENKHHSINEAYSQFSSFPVQTSSKGVNFSSPGVESTNKPGPEMKQDQLIRQIQEETLQLLSNHNSPLCYIDLKDVLNLEEFKRLITNDEQEQLLKYLPLIDTVAIPDSLKSMFNSPQFVEDISAFQKLLAEGVFDFSPSLGKSERNGNLKRLVLGNLTRSSWVKHYNLLKDVKCENNPGSSFVAAGPPAVAFAQSMKVKRSRDSQFQNHSGGKTTMKSPKRVSMKVNYDNKELVDNDATYFSPKSLFALPPDNTSLMLDSFQFDEHSDQDLLLNVPSHSSFPQAELLMPTSSFNAQASTSSSSIYQNHVQP